MRAGLLFAQLEKLFTCIGVTIKATKKDHVLEYVDFNVEQLWKIFPEYTDLAKTYANFKKVIQVHYLDATRDHIYSFQDLEMLIKSCLCNGMKMVDDLQEFHLVYLAILTWLINKDQLGKFKQRKNYMQAFQQLLLSAIKANLHINFLKHLPNMPLVVVSHCSAWQLRV